ncbi:hypothetical protein [Corallococcus sp. M7]
MPLDFDAFQKTLVYQARATVPEVLEDLRAMEPRLELAMDARVAQSSSVSRTLRRWGVGLLLGALGIFGGIQLLPTGPGVVLSFLLVIPCFFAAFGGVVALCVGALGGKTPRALSPDEQREVQRRLLLATLLKRFQVDLVKDAPVDVTLDVAPVLDSRKRVHQGPQGPWDRQDFVDPWLSLRGRFADGTQLHLSVVDQVCKRHRVARSASGRKKHKHKRNGVSLMTVALRVDPERHPRLAVQEKRTSDAVRLPPGARLKRLRVAEDRVELRVLLDEDWVARPPKAVPPSEPRSIASPRLEAPSKTDASRTATMMLLSLYQVLYHSSSRVQPGKMRSTS